MGKLHRNFDGSIILRNNRQLTTFAAKFLAARTDTTPALVAHFYKEVVKTDIVAMQKAALACFHFLTSDMRIYNAPGIVNQMLNSTLYLKPWLTRRFISLVDKTIKS
jgi:hypothetical protein